MCNGGDRGALIAEIIWYLRNNVNHTNAFSSLGAYKYNRVMITLVHQIFQ